MRDEPGTRRSLSILFTLCLTCVLARPSGAQSVRGSTDIQYQNLDSPGVEDDRELWVSGLQVDVTKRFEQRLDLSAQLLFRGVNYAGRPEGTQNPRGTVRVTHPYFGFMGSYRPVRITDQLGMTSHRDEIQLSGYAARERWPTLTASWTRRAARLVEGQPSTVGIARTFNASYEFGRSRGFGLHAGYSDQGRDAEGSGPRTNFWRSFMGGAAARVGSSRANLAAQVDATETRNFVRGVLAERNWIQSLGVNGGVQHSRKAASSLAYAFRRSQGENGGRYTLDDHEGLAQTRFAVTRAISVSGGGGVRSVRTIADRELQTYVLLTGTAEGPIRPGWTGGAGVSRSWNWIGSSHPRPIDTYQVNTRMNLANGLDVLASGQVNVTESGVTVQVDSLGRSADVVSQASATVSARPLRPIIATYSLRTYRAGESLTGPVTTSNSDALDLRWTPAASLQLWGSVSRTRGYGFNAPYLLVRQANAQWTPSRRLELSGNWWRSDESRADPTATLPPSRETMAGRLLIGLTRDLKTTFIVSASDPGRPTRSTRIEATATLGFGR